MHRCFCSGVGDYVVWSSLYVPGSGFSSCSFSLFFMLVFHNQCLNCEKVTVLITTDQVNRIEEIVELNVGNMKYEIKEETCDPLLMKGNMNKNDYNSDSIMENRSESSPDTGKNSLSLDDNLNCSVEEDVLEVMSVKLNRNRSCWDFEQSLQSSNMQIDICSVNIVLKLREECIK
ncbi:hypothetical protein V6N13_033091 [Hibiscus sabdariffa]